MAFDWPSVLVPRHCDPELRNFVKRGGRAATGREQRAFSDAGFWEVAMQIPIHTKEKTLAYRAMMARLRQGEEVNIRLPDRTMAEGGNVPSSSAVLSGAHDLRATQLSITATGIEIVEGTLFSLVHRLHQVTEVVSGGAATFHNPVTTQNTPWDDDQPWNDGDPNTVNYVVKIMPPLRRNYADGQGVRFTGLSLTSVLADINDGDLSLDLGRFGTASLTFRESI